jgi:hypothetical protein
MLVTIIEYFHSNMKTAEFMKGQGMMCDERIVSRQRYLR